MHSRTLLLDIDCVIPNIVRRLLSNKTLPKRFATYSLQEVGIIFLTTQILSIMRKTRCSKTLFLSLGAERVSATSCAIITNKNATNLMKILDLF